MGLYIRDHIGAPTEVLVRDLCSFGLSRIWTVAHVGFQILRPYTVFARYSGHIQCSLNGHSGSQKVGT